MEKILSNSFYTFIGFLIGLIIVTPIADLYELWSNIPLLLILLFITSLVCGMLKYFFIDN